MRDVPEKKRFEIWVGDALAGFTVYQPRPERFLFVHTEIDDAFGGRGLASVLIKQMLDEMRTRGLGVLPQCPFVRRYISRHQEYLDLVPAHIGPGTTCRPLPTADPTDRFQDWPSAGRYSLIHLALRDPVLPGAVRTRNGSGIG